MTLDGAPERVAVHREGELTRVSFERVDLGLAFAGGDRFQWLWAPEPGRAAARRSHCPEALLIERGRGEVSLSLRLRPEVSVQLRREGSAVLLVFREDGGPGATTLAEATPTPPEAGVPVPARPPRSDGGRAGAPERASRPSGAVRTPDPWPPAVADSRATPPGAAVPAGEPTAVPPEPRGTLVAALVPLGTESGQPPSADLVTRLLRTLGGAEDEPLPVAGDGVAPTGAGAATEEADAESLYYQLFPHAAPDPAPAEPGPDAGGESHEEGAFRIGGLAFQPALRVAYVDASASLLADTGTVVDRYLEIRPGVGLGASLGMGRLRAEYEPTLRSFGSFGPTEDATHTARASLEVPAEGPFRLVASDAWMAGALEVQEVDPGGEYFFDLRRFRRNSLAVAASYEMAPRWTLEAGASLNQVRFTSPGAFFDHDTRGLDLGLGYELTESLRASVAYVRDRVPPTAERPQAESTANGVQAVLAGEATPLLSAQLMLGYREQEHPFAAEGGRTYRGLVVGGSLTQTLGLVSSVTLGGSRTALLSAFEENGFYVSSQVQTAAVVRLPYGLLLDGTVGYRWNDYRTVAREIGMPRDDTVLDWGMGLRRRLGRGRSTVGMGYQRQRHRSNIDRFDTTTDRLVIELDFGALSTPGIR